MTLFSCCLLLMYSYCIMSTSSSLLSLYYFEGVHDVADDDDWSGSGDVKYHLGTSNARTLSNGKDMHLSLLPNPSHLEAVDPLVLGMSRAKADCAGDPSYESVLPIIMHGDAAFAGQGVVYECMQMAGLPNYKTGGSIHVICNNQVGFTTDPEHGRSTKCVQNNNKTSLLLSFSTLFSHVFLFLFPSILLGTQATLEKRSRRRSFM